MRTLCFVLAVVAASVLSFPTRAEAVPKRIIIMRHGEKQNAYALCPVGVDRSLALAANYLGRGAAKALLAPGEKPAAFFAITLHSLELIAPAAATWQAPVIDYSVVPIFGKIDVPRLNARTREAAHDVLTDSRWDGKTVIIAWEHHHIADAMLDRHYSNVTLRALLHLDALGDAVPKTWSGHNYDYFWIVDYGNPNSTTPTAFHVVKQVFPKPYQEVPQNDWGVPENLPTSSACEQ